MNSNQIYETVENIASASGKNAKIALLAEYLKDPDFLKVVVYALDPFITYGQRPARVIGTGVNLWNDDTFKMLDALSSRQLTGNAAKQIIEQQMRGMNAPSAELLWRVLNKDLRADFGESSVNKARKGTFKSFPYMRCSLTKDVDLATWPWEKGVISQVKADGMFVNVTVEPGAVIIASRQGTVFPAEGFESLTDILKTASVDAPVQLHGELLVIDPAGAVQAREIGNGMINSVIQGGELPAGYSYRLDLWDMVLLSAVQPKGKYAVPYLMRLSRLNALIKTLASPQVKLIETRVVRSLKEAFEHYSSCLARKLEGTVLKNPNMIWEDKTSKGQVKLKLEATCELRVKGFKEGKEGKKTANTFGSLQLQSECGELEVFCSGFPDDLRAEINANRDDWVEAIVTVVSNGILYAKKEGKKHSLFLPRFSERRFDRDKADDLARIESEIDSVISNAGQLTA